MKTLTFQTRTSNAIASHRKRAAAAGQHLDYGLAELRELVLNAIHGPCAHCGEPITEQNFSCDHAQPTSRGGSYHLDNLRIICTRCNKTKGPLSDEEYAALLDLVWKWDCKARHNVLSRLLYGGRMMR